jgi:adenine-specific DNA-methyltransferase
LNVAAYRGSPLRVLAGPGTGKMFAIMRRVSRLLEEGENPKDIDFQTAEVVIPNPQRNQLTIAQFRKLAEYEIDKTKMNRLIWGDNMLAMRALLASGYEGKINLIYIDPPFWTGEDHYANFVVEGKAITKEPSAIEKKY